MKTSYSQRFDLLSVPALRLRGHDGLGVALGGLLGLLLDRADDLGNLLPSVPPRRGHLVKVLPTDRTAVDPVDVVETAAADPVVVGARLDLCVGVEHLLEADGALEEAEDVLGRGVAVVRVAGLVYVLLEEGEVA